ncbi:MAG TPA: YeeE/YedE thiosulfate transporter family protein [Planctomycetota bacterium]|nr:YeeE/YedE thiosulfate transporter family protein [Planctomycetota bacterium]
MLTGLHDRKDLQLVLGLVVGILFGFLLQKGGVTKYDVIIGQLLLEDFTVVKVMLTAVITGMIGVHLLVSLGLAQLHPKPGSVGSTVVGGLIFGVGFALLGYCPGTVAGAVGNGYLDALFGGVVGVLIGAGLFAALYPRLNASLLNRGNFGEVTWPQLLKVNPWVVVPPAAVLLIGLLVWLENTWPSP